jgi:ion channel
VMVIQLSVSSFVSVINIMIHALATVAAVGIARRAGRKFPPWPRLHLMGVMVATVLMLMLAHMIEIVVWSLCYALVGAAPDGSELLYFAFVNYTTLGYGDVTPVKEWRLVGPMAAMNGILMFGWSTAVLFEVLLKTIEHIGAISPHGTPFSAADRN